MQMPALVPIVSEQIPINLESYDSWAQSYGNLLRYLTNLSSTCESFILNDAIKFRPLEPAFSLLQDLDKCFITYYDTPDYLGEDRALIAGQSIKLCIELNKCLIVDLDEKFVNAIKEILNKMNLALQKHIDQIQDINFCHYATHKISDTLHTYHPARAKKILNSETCKKHPVILQKAMLNIVEFSYGRRVDSIELLLSNVFNINQPFVTQWGSTSLLSHALNICRLERDDVDETSAFKLLELGATVENSNMHFAIKYNSQKLVEALLEKKPDYQPNNSDYGTLIDLYKSKFCASEQGEKENKRIINIIRLFCKRGPLPSSNMLLSALCNGKFDIAKILMEEFSIELPSPVSDWDIGTIIRKCKIEELHFLKPPISKNILSPYCNYKTLSAVKIQYCVANGASIEKTDLDSPGILQSPEIVKNLIALGKNIHQTLPDKHGKTISLLHYAAIHGHPETIRLLIAAGADFNAKNKDGWTPLHYAAAYHNIGAVKALILGGADFNAVDNNMQMPLHAVVITCMGTSDQKIPCAKILLRAGANPDLKDVYNKTALESLDNQRLQAGERYEVWCEAFETKPSKTPDVSEIRTNSQVLAQARRTGTGFFAMLPDETLVQISSLIGNNADVIEHNEKDYEIARNHFCKPQ